MTGEGSWDPERLSRLTMVQLQCLLSKEAPGSEPVLTSGAEAIAAMEAIERDDREWYQQ